MKDLKLGIVGGGVVGQATARSYIEHVAEVRVYDVLPERRTDDLRRVLECDLVMVCLPTPQCKDSLRCDMSAVDAFFHGCSSTTWHKQNYVLRSTVPIGTTKRLRETHNLFNLVHSPEFLTARCAQVDAQMPARNIIGVPNKRAEWKKAREMVDPGESIMDCDFQWPKVSDCEVTLWKLYKARFSHVPVLSMTSDESEAVKLMRNSAFAVKVAFWNEMWCLADKLGLDWETVRGAILADGRIHPSHTLVPGPDGKRGFGGSCLPKDLANLISCFWENKVDGGAKLLQAAQERNEVDRKRGGS